MDLLEAKNQAEVKEILKKKPIVVFFYWKDCGHCQDTMPHWDSMCKNKSKHGLGDVKMVKVEKDVIPSEFGITSFPTFQIVNKKGKKSTVSGSRDSEEILAADLLKSLREGGGRTRRRYTRRLVRRVRKTRHRR
jgi:thiol-disulfide isomerase/thioredoxin